MSARAGGDQNENATHGGTITFPVYTMDYRYQCLMFDWHIETRKRYARTRTGYSQDRTPKKWSA